MSTETRSQEERIASLHKGLDRIAAKYKIGHTLLLFELEKDGEKYPCLGTLSNVELGGAPGIFELERDGAGRIELRAEEMLLQAWAGVVTNGFPKVEIGKDVVVFEGRVLPEEETEALFAEKKEAVQ